MASDSGYIMLHRKLKRNFLWQERRVFSRAEAWIDLIWEVQWKHEPEEVAIKNKTLTCYRGESLKSLETWARRWTWTKPKVKRFLDTLMAHEMVVIVNEGVTTRIRIVNYDEYQISEVRRNANRNGNVTQIETETLRTSSEKDIENSETQNGNVTQTETETLRDCYTEEEYKESKKEETTESSFQEDSPPRTTKKRTPNCPYDAILTGYRKTLKDLPPIEELTDGLKRTVRNRWQEKPDLSWWSAYWQYVSESDFLMGRKKEWKASFPWLVGPENMGKVLGGQYHNGKRNPLEGVVSDKTQRTIDNLNNWNPEKQDA